MANTTNKKTLGRRVLGKNDLLSAAADDLGIADLSANTNTVVPEPIKESAPEPIKPELIKESTPEPIKPEPIKEGAPEPVVKTTPLAAAAEKKPAPETTINISKMDLANLLLRKDVKYSNTKQTLIIDEKHRERLLAISSMCGINLSQLANNIFHFIFDGENNISRELKALQMQFYKDTMKRMGGE